jgi:ribosomal protein L29
MAKLKANDVRKMSNDERKKKIEEMKFELVKAKANAAKSGSSKAKNVKKIIARILTINNQEKNSKGVEHK